MAPTRSTSERCAMLLVTTGIFVVWSGVACAVIEQLIGHY
jgi:hypothetical protein